MKSVFKIIIQDSAANIQSYLIVAADTNTAVTAAQTQAGVAASVQPLQINPFGTIAVEV
jgi:hypothetical protein